MRAKALYIIKERKETKMTDNVLARNELSVIDEEKPYASYMKTILGQVGVNVWDRFLNQPAYVILQGDPRRKDETTIVDVWNAKENAFFQRNNKRHFDKGILMAYTRPEVVVQEDRVEQYTDEQLKEIINAKFLGLRNKLSKIESIAVLFRMVTLAEEMEKSSKIVRAIEARISELQMAAYGEKPEVTDEEEE
jgi:hypothetical protein